MGYKYDEHALQNLTSSLNWNLEALILWSIWLNHKFLESPRLNTILSPPSMKLIPNIILFAALVGTLLATAIPEPNEAVQNVNEDSEYIGGAVRKVRENKHRRLPLYELTRMSTQPCSGTCSVNECHCAFPVGPCYCHDKDIGKSCTCL